MSRRVDPIPTGEDYARLAKRVLKYLDFALTHKKPTDDLVRSSVLFIEGERQLAVIDYQKKHRPETWSKWDHLKELFK